MLTLILMYVKVAQVSNLLLLRPIMPPSKPLLDNLEQHQMF